MNPSTFTITEIGGTQALTVTVLDEDGNVVEDPVVVWNSSDEAIAIADKVGVVTAVAEGTVTIAAASGAVSGLEGTVEL